MTQTIDTVAEDRGGMFLTFVLADEQYGIEILKVREIVGMLDITPIPRTPDYIRGILNLRGKVFPVIDLRAKFGMPTREATEETCIIVVHVEGAERGIIVDKVSEVETIAAADIEDAPSFGDEVETEYILGLAKAENRVTILLNIDHAVATRGVLPLNPAAVAATDAV